MSENIKPYLNIDEQIKKLREIGLIKNSDKNARIYLEDIGYYNLINRYRDAFRYKIKKENNENEKYIYYDNVTIEDFYQLYKFDDAIRHLFFQYLCRVETKIKSKMSDLISKKYGVDDKQYLKPENFKPDNERNNKIQFSKIQAIFKKAINTKKNDMMKHFAKKGYYPFWIISNVLTLGDVSLIFIKLKDEDQNEIARSLGLRQEMLVNILEIATLFRNASAHNERFYSYKTIRFLKSNEIKHFFRDFRIEQKNGRYKYGTNDLLACVIIFKLIFRKSEFKEFVDKLNSDMYALNKTFNINKGKTVPDTFLVNSGIVINLNNLINYDIHHKSI